VRLIWNGKDITSYVNVTGCVHRDVSSGRSDCLELTLDHASVWYRWGPQEDDEIVVDHNGYSTGTLYLSAVIPTGDQYRVLATSANGSTRRKAWGCYENTTLERIMVTVAAECGMEGKIFGADGSLPYDFVLRQNEGSAAFLTRIGEWEGMCVKAYHGAFRGISVPWAQERNPIVRLELNDKQDGVTYRRREGLKYTGLTIQSPYAKATAHDKSVRGNNIPILVGLPAMNNAQAGRWARGMLLMHNRLFEELTIEQRLNLNMSAMMRVDIIGSTDAAGKWIVDEAEHDLMGDHTTAKLLRVIDTIQ